MSPVPANNRDITKEDDESDISASNAPQFAIDNSDSESDGAEEDGDGYQGYQLLPQDPDGVLQGQEEEEEGEGPVDANPPVPAPSPPSAVDEVIMQSLDNQDMMNAVSAQGQAEEEEPEPSERAEVWNSPPPASAASIPMDEDHVEKIRSAMSGFALPPAAQPAWAGELSDEDWKQFLKLQASSMTLNSAKPQRSQHKTSKEKTVDR